MRAVIIKTFLLIAVFIFGVLVASVISSPKRAFAQACATPAQVTGVLVSYPSCVGDQCNFTQASCSWTALAGASKYQVAVTEVESNTSVYNQQVDSTITSVSFSITQGKTYKCDVSAINSCGNTGPAGTHQLLCQANAGVTTTPTAAPTSPPPTAAPTIQPGATTTTIATIGISLIFIALGGLLFLL